MYVHCTCTCTCSRVHCTVHVVVYIVLYMYILYVCVYIVRVLVHGTHTCVCVHGTRTCVYILYMHLLYAVLLFVYSHTSRLPPLGMKTSQYKRITTGDKEMNPDYLEKV